MTAPVGDHLRVDRTAFSVVPNFEKADERAYWHVRSPAERLRYMEMLRRINYGDRAADRLEKGLEVVPLDGKK